ncbi:MAG: family 10 glycosylhydrolase [bacterium]
MKKLLCLLVILFLSCTNIVAARSFQLPYNKTINIEKPKLEMPEMPNLTLPNAETLNISKPDFSLQQSDIDSIKNLHQKTIKRLKSLNDKNLLIMNKKKKNKPACPTNMQMLMSSPETINIDVQKIPFGNEVSFYKISDINPKKSDENPGGRGINELIVYTNDYGLKTGTNEYGKEAIIVNNQVVALSSMDSIIPLNGFVISGHGKAKQWMEKNVILGARVDINTATKTISSIITPETYVFEAEEKIREAQEINDYYKKMKCSMLQSDFYIDKANSSLNYAKCYSSQFDIVMAKKYAKNSMVYSDRAIACAVPYVQSEFKGIWIRPKDRNPEKIGLILDNLKRVGIDTVFVETYYHGMTIFPSETLKSYGLVQQRPEFMNTDVLQSWIDEAHKRNMKVHVWFQTFYIGNEAVSPMPKLLKLKHPEWLNRQYWFANSDEVQPSLAEHLGYFLDPANPEVQEYLMKILKEIVCKYDVDGVNIDYIRYPVCSSPNSSDFLSTSWGYTKYAIDEFQKTYGISPLEMGSSNPNWYKWECYRRDKVTCFVEKLGDLKKIRSNITISAVVFPDKNQSAVVKLQDWAKWGQRGYLDAFTPLFLSSNIDFTEKYLRDMMACKGANVKLYAGLFDPFTQTEPTNLPQEIKVLRELNADGIVIFDYAHFTKAYQQVLSIRAFNRNSK